MEKIKNGGYSVLFLIVGSIVLLFASCSQKGISSKDFRIIGYLYNKQININKLPYQYLTAINYSFVVPAPDSTGHTIPLKYPNRLNELAKIAHSHGVKVFISVGGDNLGDGPGNDTRFEVLANNKKMRTNFVQSAMHLVRKFNLDGVDIDWEYPDP